MMPICIIYRTQYCAEIYIFLYNLKGKKTMKNINNYPFLNLLENINASADDRIDLEEVEKAKEVFEKHISFLGYDANEFITTEKGVMCLCEDLFSYGSECRVEGLINGYITAMRILKGEIL